MSATGIRFGWHSEAGRRSSNQDAILVEVLPGGRELYALADGMGGHRAGEVASRRALEVLAASLRHGAGLREAVEAANTAVYDAAAAEPEWEGMGTTVVALLRAADRYEIVNVGDSRAYRVEAAGVRQITADHSFEAEAVVSGRLSAAEAARSPWRRALTRAVGTDRQLEADLFGPFDASEPHAIVLCSDGLYGSIPEEALQRSLADGTDPDDAARSLAGEAFRNGSADNISVAVLVFGDPNLSEPAVAGSAPSHDAGPLGPGEPGHAPAALDSPAAAPSPAAPDEMPSPAAPEDAPFPAAAAPSPAASPSPAVPGETAGARPSRMAGVMSYLGSSGPGARRLRRRRARRPFRLTALEVSVILVLLGAALGFVVILARIF